MKILPITPKLNRAFNRNNNPHINRNESCTANFKLHNTYYTPVFTAKKLNITQEKSKLIKLFDEILKKNSSLESEEDLILKTANCVARFISTKIQKMRQIESQANVVANSKVLTDIQKYETINALRREYLKIEKSLPRDNYKTPEKDNKNTDFLLINKLKTSVLNDNYNLNQVAKEHYLPLLDMKSTDEIEAMYPMIKFPKRPEIIIAKKVVKTMPRSFFLTLDEYALKSDAKGLEEYTKSQFPDILKNTIGKNTAMLSFDSYSRLEEAIANEIIDRYESYMQRNALGSLPEKVKFKVPIATDEDIKLLSVNYDKYILSVISSIYVDMKKPAEISYKANDIEIKLSKLNDSAYKFEKFPEKIKQFIKTALEIKRAERMYESYSDNEFKSRILFYTDKLGEHEHIFEKLAEFDSCMFTKEDKEQLSVLLNTLDLVFDNEITTNEAITTIKNIKPNGTAKIKEELHSSAIQKLKKEQKTAAKLRCIQDEFDSAINILYQNNLNYAAEIASFYRPVKADESNEHYRFIIDIIKKYSNPQTGISESKNILNKSIIFWNKYIEAKIESSPELAKAEEWGTNKNGSIDKIKAGKYLFYSAIADSYHDIPGYQNEINDIIEKFSFNDKETKIEYMCKYDDFKNIQNYKISDVIKIFGTKTPIGKAITKYIVENNYITFDTVSQAKINKNDSVETIISAKAKREIFNYYMYPKCLEFFEAFEDAMTMFAANKASAGIKKLGKNNNSLANINELKIIGYDDRLIAYNGSYYFDEFTPVGIH